MATSSHSLRTRSHFVVPMPFFARVRMSLGVSICLEHRVTTYWICQFRPATLLSYCYTSLSLPPAGINHTSTNLSLSLMLIAARIIREARSTLNLRISSAVRRSDLYVSRQVDEENTNKKRRRCRKRWEEVRVRGMRGMRGVRRVRRVRRVRGVRWDGYAGRLSKKALVLLMVASSSFSSLVNTGGFLRSLSSSIFFSLCSRCRRLVAISLLLASWCCTFFCPCYSLVNIVVAILCFVTHTSQTLITSWSWCPLIRVFPKPSRSGKADKFSLKYSTPNCMCCSYISTILDGCITREAVQQHQQNADGDAQGRAWFLRRCKFSFKFHVIFITPHILVYHKMSIAYALSCLMNKIKEVINFWIWIWFWNSTAVARRWGWREHGLRHWRSSQVCCLHLFIILRWDYWSFVSEEYERSEKICRGEVDEEDDSCWETLPAELRARISFLMTIIIHI